MNKLFISKSQAFQGLAWLLLALGPATVAAQFSFQDVSAARGMTGYVMAVGSIGGVAAADYDNDGDIDVFLPTAEGTADLLMVNDGAGNFSNIAAQAGLASLDNNRLALWFDYDGDGRLDLAVGGDCRLEPLADIPCEQEKNLRLYHQQSNGTFSDVTVEAGLDASWGGSGNRHRSGITAGDIDNDGYLDLYVNDWKGRAWLYRNNRDGTFTDVTVASGLSDDFFEYHQPVMYDFNRDGWTDILVAVDFATPNQLWVNQGDGTFVDQAESVGLGNAMTDMGIALGDYDNDLDMDIYITNITRAGDYDVFYRNDSTGQDLVFTEIAESIGVWQGYWGWGTTFLDVDNDGWEDLAVTNGKNTGQWISDPSLFYYNEGGNPVSFSDRSESVGFDDTIIASGLIAFDFDRDGDLDLLQTGQDTGAAQLYQNDQGQAASGNRYLVVRPRMNGPNHFAIGAEVIVTAGSKQMMRVIKTGTSMAGQEPAEAFFGLGDQQTVDQVLIKWPDGSQSTVSNIGAGQIITVEQQESGIEINAGLNDAWYDPSTSGQGFFITVFPDIAKMFLAWFTYDTERPDPSITANLGGPGQRWLTAFGSYSGNEAVLEIEMTSGGVFDSANPSPIQQADGDILLEFTSCNAATITYSISSADRQGVIPIERIALDNVGLCEAAQ